MLADRPFRPE
ncbi:unnamed protein product, partial [Rotaria sp. Silwood1]